MFKLKSAHINYGKFQTCDFTLSEKFQQIESIVDINLVALKDEAAVASGGYLRKFTIKLVPEIRFTQAEHGVDLHIPEMIFASADGYNVTWVKEE